MLPANPPTVTPKEITLSPGGRYLKLCQVSVLEQSALAKSRWFRAFQGQELPTDESALRYLDSVFTHFYGNAIWTKNATRRALSRNLSARGYGPESYLQPRASLEAQSLINLQALLKGTIASEQICQELPSLCQSVEKIKLLFQHNTSADNDSFHLSLPLLSSRQLELMGFEGGLNSSDFNRRFEKSDDHVFFTIRYSQREKPQAQTTGYFGNPLFLKSTYARTVGWVTAEEMDPHNLVLSALASQTRSDIPEEDRVSLEELDSLAWEEQGSALIGPSISRKAFIYAMQPGGNPLNFGCPTYHADDFQGFSHLHPTWKKIRRLQRYSDFTLPHFEQLIRTKLLNELYRLNRSKSPSDQSDWQLAKEVIGRNDPHQALQLLALIKYHVFLPLGLSLEWELKVPVLVPPTEFTVGVPGN